MEPKCPHMVGKGNPDEFMVMCDLVDKWCLVEHGQECEEYNKFLEEEQDGTNQ